MLSVLIPTYNYDISALIAELHQQLIKTKKAFEILVLEDGSTKDINDNSTLSHTTIIVNKNNNGRVKARQLLAEKAQYDWLLFLDADVAPKNETFIAQYLKAIDSNNDAVFGGFTYHDTKPEDSYLLRWTYGKTKEEIPANIRNKKKYKVIISANFLIKKTVFLTINSEIPTSKGYGFDNYFGTFLKLKAISVLHIDNEVYHLGIEKSDTYLRKKEQAALTLLKLYNKNNSISSDNDLLNLFMTLKRWKLAGIFSSIHQWLKVAMKNNLLGKKPSIKILQLYRISFMCNSYKPKE
ncbi:glycosyltransferase family 2 protein [uncultured Lacinutrix sp.]|uniref:glycosyltransferase family 2 protein n=1 Tax=uncultured Lacinutrix sp. TaxID=574032 RepID=UPI00262EF87A|nr:glycosyltransferase family 2 protein [uncultured Lacinutrix sp.]